MRAANLSERLRALDFGISILEVSTNQLYPSRSRLAGRPGASVPGVVQRFCSRFGLDWCSVRRSVSTQMLMGCKVHGWSCIRSTVSHSVRLLDQQARKRQDAQAEKLTSLKKAQKLKEDRMTR